MRGRGSAIVLGLLLVAGWAGAYTLGGAPVAGQPPRGAPPLLPIAGVGSAVVELSADAAAHPAGDTVRQQLQRHYDAINRHDYAAWRETVVPRRADMQPEQRWRSDYDSVRDGSVRVDRIDDVQDGLIARVRFVSTQDLDHTPPGVRSSRICWRVTLPMEGSPPRIGVTKGGSSVPEAC